MKVSVTGKQFDVGDSLRHHAEAMTAVTATKYFDKAIEAHVVFFRERHLVRAELSVHAGRGLTVQCGGVSGVAYAAFDVAAERLDTRLRRYKRRLRNHHARAKEDENEVQPATAYVLAIEDRGKGPDPEDLPLVIAEIKTSIPRLSVSDAVMRLDLSEMPALLFRNRTHDNLNLVYRRRDGNIGWIDPELSQRHSTASDKAS
jgi:ribosomal subunit interface protein